MSNSLQRLTVPNVISNTGTREIKVIVATEDVARDGNVLVISGIDLSSYRSNPVVLWGHDQSQPIARCTEIAAQGKTLRATVSFPPAGVSTKADEVLGLVKSGVVNACSIGWIPTAQEPLKDKSGRQVGWRFTSSDMLEFSIVSVPADPAALVVERAASRAGKVLSGANEGHLRAAVAHVQAVLDQVEPPEDGNTDGDGRGERARRAKALRLATQAEDDRRELARQRALAEIDILRLTAP
jgi:HK97 family phage prohead protease